MVNLAVNFVVLPSTEVATWWLSVCTNSASCSAPPPFPAKMMRCSVMTALLATVSGYSPLPTSTALNEANPDQVFAEQVAESVGNANIAPFIYDTEHTTSKYGTPCKDAVPMKCKDCLIECVDGDDSCFGQIVGPNPQGKCYVTVNGAVRARTTNRDFTYGEHALCGRELVDGIEGYVCSDSRLVS